MTPDQEERIVVAWEKIAGALEGLNDRSERAFAKQYPDKERREAIGSRVPTPEDKIRENQGVGAKSDIEWLSELQDDRFIGDREAEYLREHPEVLQEKRGNARSKGQN